MTTVKFLAAKFSKLADRKPRVRPMVVPERSMTPGPPGIKMRAAFGLLGVIRRALTETPERVTIEMFFNTSAWANFSDRQIKIAAKIIRIFIPPHE